MTTYIELEENQQQLNELVEQTQRGMEVIITQGHRPIAKLIAIPPRGPRRFGSAKDLIKIAEDFDEPLEDFDELTR